MNGSTDGAVGRRAALAVAAVGAGLLATGLLAACGSSSDPERADGSGSTFARPAFDVWCAESDLCVYRGVGSGAGVREVVDQDTEFGASDVPMTPDEEAAFATTAGDVAQAGSAPIQLPALIGAITIPTRIAGVDDTSERLRLRATTLARIMSGEIARWSDPSIAADNPGVELPDRPITRCVRKDSSGTTGVLTEYLAAADPGFAESVGVSRLPDWPGGRVVESPGNPGVAACIEDRDDAIGYVDLADAVTVFGDGAAPERIDALSEIGVERNGATEWVAPTSASAALAGSMPFPASEPLTSYGRRLLDSDVPGAYPIAATTFLIVHDRYADAATCDEVVDTARWILSSRGQRSLVRSYYSPVGDSVRARALARLSRVSDADGRACGGDDRPE